MGLHRCSCSKFGRLPRLLALLLVVAPASAQVDGDPGPLPGAPPPTSAPPADAPEEPTPGDPAFAVYRARLAAELPDLTAAVQTDLERTAKTWNALRKPSRRRRPLRATDARSKFAREIADAHAELGLAWLAAHQARDGSWAGAGFGHECGKLDAAGGCDGAGAPYHDAGLTALALLCFLQAEQGDEGSRYGATVEHGLAWLGKQQSDAGRVGRLRGGPTTYDHHIGALALVEAARRLGGSERIRMAKSALAYTYASRHAGAAWRYDSDHPDMLAHPDDTSVTAWAVLTMASARDAGLPRDEEAWHDAFAFLDYMTDRQTGRTGYVQRGADPARLPGTAAVWPSEQSESLTAIGVLCRLLCAAEDEDAAAARSRRAAADPAPCASDDLHASIALLQALPPLWDSERPGRVDYYYWFFGTRAMARVGGDAWGDWLEMLVDVFVDHGVEPGDAVGSWAPQRGPWGSIGGRVYSTAMMTLAALEARETR